MMPDDTGPRKAVRDAASEMARTIRDADAGRKSVRDAAEASRPTSRSGGEAIRQTPERASETASRIASNAADSSQQVAKRSAEQFEASQDVTRHAQQNLDVLIQVGGVLAGGFQSILREWTDYAQSAVQGNIDGLNSLMRARTPQDLASAQSNLLASELHLLLDRSARISEATARLARD